MPGEGCGYPRAVIRREGAKSAFALSHPDVSSHVPFGVDARGAAAPGTRTIAPARGLGLVRLSYCKEKQLESDRVLHCCLLDGMARSSGRPMSGGLPAGYGDSGPHRVGPWPSEWGSGGSRPAGGGSAASGGAASDEPQRLGCGRTSHRASGKAARAGRPAVREVSRHAGQGATGASRVAGGPYAGRSQPPQRTLLAHSKRARVARRSSPTGGHNSPRRSGAGVEHVDGRRQVQGQGVCRKRPAGTPAG